MATQTRRPNPFPVVPVCLYSEDGLPTAVTASFARAQDVLRSYLQTIEREDHSHHSPLSIRGGHGAGKTHLLAHLGFQMREARADSTRLYARAESSTLELYKQLVRQVSLTQLLELVERASRNSAVVAVDGALSSHAFVTLLPDRVDYAVRESLNSLLDPAKADEAYRWFTGEIVPGSVELDARRQSDILQALAALHRLAGVPLLVLIDQLEGLTREAPEEFYRSTSFVMRLIEHFTSEGALLAIAGHDEAWSAMPPDVVHRFSTSHLLNVGKLTVEETGHLIDVLAYEGARPPQWQETVTDLRDVANGNPRTILGVAYRLYELYDGDLGRATYDDMAKVASEYEGSVAASTIASADASAARPATRRQQTKESAASPSPDARVREQQRAKVAPDVPDGTDLLDIRREVRALSAVIAAHDTSPPLSIGLFGDWGTGKSFFMNRMEERIDKLKQTARSNPDSAYCPNIVQLRFNAWHYMDTDLWASLAAEIFEGLSRALEQDEGLLAGLALDSTAARARLLAETSHLHEVRAQAEQRKTDTDAALRKSEGRLARLEHEEREIVARLSPKQLAKAAYRFVVSQERTARAIEGAAEELGIPASKALATETRATLLEMKGVAGGVKAVWLGLRSGSPTLWIGFIVAFLAVVGAFALLGYYRTQLGPAAIATVMFISSALTIARKVIAPTQSALKMVNEARSQSETIINEERDRREAELRSAHKAIQERSNAEQTAIARLGQEIAQLEQQLEALRADRQLADFVRNKQEGTDYTKHFGVIARARHDFQQLSTLLQRVVTEGAHGTAATTTGKGPAVPRIDRIVLYIDDLDRCPEAKVVDVLQAVHLLLALPLFIVVVGVDSRWLLHSLRQHSTVFKSDNEENDGLAAEERVHWQSTPFNYLEKIFQVPFNLKPMNKDGFVALIDDLTIAKARSAALQPVARGGDGRATAENHTRLEGTGLTGAGAPATVSKEGPAVPRTEPSPTPAVTTVPRVTAISNQPTLTPAAVTSREQHETAGDDDPVEPNPPFLEPNDTERRFMHRMHPLIPTPRAAKRYVNVYRLLRASLRDDDRAVLEDEAGGCRPVLLMLAILTGFPQEGTVILRELVDHDPDVSWWVFLMQLATRNVAAGLARSEATGAAQNQSKPGTQSRVAVETSQTQPNIEARQRAQRWADLAERMILVRNDLKSELGEAPPCKDFSRWAKQVARYSFEAGRLVADQTTPAT
jgi:predicted ATPase